MQRSSIEWTDFTSNPIQYRNAEGKIVWACVHCSPGCSHCYAEALTKRYKRGAAFTVPNMTGLAPFMDDDELRHMLRYKPASGKRCFIGDMTDIFGEWVPDDLLNQLFSNVLEMREDVQWQILTKRADRMQKYLSWRWGEGRIPMRNIWLGVSVENQQYADERIPRLLQTPAAVRFVSYEPALSAVDFLKWFVHEYESPQHGERCSTCGIFTNALHWSQGRSGIDWMIVGGESGPGARPFNIRWARDVIAQCKAAGVACFVKQLGARPFTEIVGQRLVLIDRKGGDMAEWEESLRVREFPR